MARRWSRPRNRSVRIFEAVPLQGAEQGVGVVVHLEAIVLLEIRDGLGHGPSPPSRRWSLTGSAWTRRSSGSPSPTTPRNGDEQPPCDQQGRGEEPRNVEVEIEQEAEVDLAPLPGAVGPFSAALFSSSPRTFAAIEAMVADGLSMDEAIERRAGSRGRSCAAAGCCRRRQEPGSPSVHSAAIAAGSGMMHQLNNLAGRYVSADAARVASFKHVLFVAHISRVEARNPAMWR
jgi:hypothetical protein